MSFETDGMLPEQYDQGENWFDAAKDREELEKALTGSDEMEELTSEIVVDDMTSIVTFGQDAAKEVSRASDEVLRSVSNSRLDDAGMMLKELAQIMGRVDDKELNSSQGGWIGKLFSRQPESVDGMLERYQKLGVEIDRIYVKLRSYEKDILEASRQLGQMLDANIDYYHRLEKYILAGEQGLREIDAYILQFQQEYARTQDPAAQFQLVSLQQARQMLERRIYDLRLAENVALQAIPMVQMIQFSNLELARKINSAFIVTLPAFKQALAHAVIRKRQSLQREALTALEARTKQMMLEAAAPGQLRQEGRIGDKKAESLSAVSLPELKEKITTDIGKTRQFLEQTAVEQAKRKERLAEART